MVADGSGLIESEATRTVIGCFYDVYNEVGPGFLEAVYENAFCLALREAGLEVVQQPAIQIFFRGRPVGEYRADIIVPGRVLIEVKAVKALDGIHEAQLLHYLKATGMPVGLLFNFGRSPKVVRRVRSERTIRGYPRRSVVDTDV